MTARQDPPHTDPPGAHAGASDPQRQKLAVVLDEYLASMERGEWPPLDELLKQHPDLADVLPSYLEGLHLLQESLGENSLDDLAGVNTLLDGARQAQPKDASSKRVGDFELINIIGRGGMGVVYEAWQLSLDRRVALKMLPIAAILDERQTARFTTEAQAAAGLHHQNIVPVYAVGQERGIHFYAMQFIDGHSLAEAIAEMQADRDREQEDHDGKRPDDATRSGHSRATNPSNATTQAHRPPSSLGSLRGSAYFRAVARLGAEAADALDHAHRYGVVHRDVKPGNLLVDRSGKLWVTDFGLARVQSEMSMTLPGDLIGSLRYMSPEQARGGALVDGRTDVYGLGATLYELMTLKPAHTGDDHKELLHRVFNDEPTPPRRLNPAIPTDLENIVVRAMEKRPEHRYATAEDLAADLRRFLEGKPTVARRPSVSDRVSKWVARRRGVAAAIGFALLAVSLVSIGSAIWIAAAGRQTAAALRQAQASQATAESHLRQARAVVDHFGGQLSDRLAEIPGAEPLRRELLSDTLGFYQRILQTSENEPAVTSDVAATYFKSGAIAERLGEPTTARDFYAKAVDYWRPLAPESKGAPDSADEDPQHDADLELALGLGALARVQGELQEFEDAQQLFNEAAGILRVLAEEEQGETVAAHALAETLSNFGLMLRRSGSQALAASNLREAIVWVEASLRASPDDPRLLRNLAVCKSNLSEALREHAPAEAIAVCRDARLAMRRLVEQHPENAEYRADLAMTYNNLAAMQGAQGDWNAAADGYQQATEQMALLVRRNPLTPRHRRELAIAQSNLGLALARVGDAPGSSQAFDVAQRSLTGLARDFPNQISYRSAMAALWNNRGVAHQAGGREAEALEAFAKAVEVQEEIAERGGITLAQASVLNRQYENYAELLRAANRDEEQQAIELRREQLRNVLDSTDAE
ncbi:Serine/threonine-protein kinase PrkC [Posidoniimonas polymericola]|uniref:Serine/threonine-protein kinase PrkC n=1 Tax=Posidoniimonas polymericola TaxID=2528002 RepID=A0A5C5YQ55_9BACT|nr:protein kinase [Posidoniimonas polymericola]TWT77003.1 Serine/threonine-protein kinase PrkC [Posidoniimonas polymericola]